MKKKKIVFTHRTHFINESYQVKKLYNMIEPEVGSIMTKSEVDAYIQSRVIEVEIQGE